MALSTYAANFMQNALVGSHTLWVGFSRANPGPDGALLDEPDTDFDGYSRVPLGDYSIVGGTITNDNDIEMPLALLSWATLTYGVLFDAETGGNMVSYGPLDAAIPAPQGLKLVIDAEALHFILE